MRAKTCRHIADRARQQPKCAARRVPCGTAGGKSATLNKGGKARGSRSASSGGEAFGEAVKRGKAARDAHPPLKLPGSPRALPQHAFRRGGRPRGNDRSVQAAGAHVGKLRALLWLAHHDAASGAEPRHACRSPRRRALRAERVREAGHGSLEVLPMGVEGELAPDLVRASADVVGDLAWDEAAVASDRGVGPVHGGKLPGRRPRGPLEGLLAHGVVVELHKAARLRQGRPVPRGGHGLVREVLAEDLLRRRVDRRVAAQLADALVHGAPGPVVGFVRQRDGGGRAEVDMSAAVAAGAGADAATFLRSARALSKLQKLRP
eukprot:CAMPEP_0176268734 /NCGR_PEP_ID=MMETSP0121_2-20121125/43827_1 /TAXON_ID=160619 /ORGANISM="Kryptoperidinium foliaceum, Strain CCMP 1326" /LENGTH=319 /DNA_ID=CAMNT_0017608837 /DNA_START=146 /DNA_END=1104 /DNA_ORIENTATION=+